MKTSTTFKTSTRTTQIFVILWVILWTIPALAQPSESGISGYLISQNDNEPLEFAHVAVFDSGSVVFIKGDITNSNGAFIIQGLQPETNYILRISSIGFETLFLPIKTIHNGVFELGKMYVSPVILSHDDVIVYGEQVRARIGTGKTSFFVSERLSQSAGTGLEIIRYIPGIHLDFNRNVHLYGTSDVVILVDGIQRDASFLSQLNATNIEQVEIYTTPPPQFSGNVGGVIEIITKRKSDRHISGHVNAEIPTRGSEIYSFPSASVTFGGKNLNLFTSYTGEFSYFDLKEHYLITGIANQIDHQFESNQQLRQEYWSHRFHAGIGYQLSPSAHVSYYGWINPFAQEFNGMIQNSTGEQFRRNDSDKNLSHFHSITAHLQLDRAGSHLLITEASFFGINSETNTRFTEIQTGKINEHRLKMNHQVLEFKPVYKGSLAENTQLETGIVYTNARYEQPTQSFTTTTYAGFGMVHQQIGEIQFSGGLRAEYHTNDILQEERSSLYWAPQAVIMYRHLASATAIRANWSMQVQQPHLFELHPGEFAHYPGSQEQGNPFLKPEIRQHFNLEMTKNIGNNFFKAGIFYSETEDAIRRISHLSEQGNFTTNYLNAAQIRHYGVELSGSMQLWNHSGIQPFIRTGRFHARPSKEISEALVKRENGYSFQFGMSAYQHIGANLTASFMLSYERPVYMVQRFRYHDTLYFVGLDYRFKNGLQAGFKSGIPFSNAFTYDAMKINQNELEAGYNGSISKSSVPVWLTLSYRFSKGLQREFNKPSDSPQTLRRGGF